jgi:PAS domain S-box-containing protein
MSSASESRPRVTAPGMAVADVAFEHAAIPAAIVDTRDPPTLVAVNRALRALTRRSREELEGMTLEDITAGLDDARALVSGTAPDHRVEALCVDASGRRIAVTIHASVLPSEEEAPSTAIVQIEEGTHRGAVERALRKSEQRLQDMADNVTALIYLKRTDGRYIFINRHYEELFGLRRAEVQSKTDFDLWPPEIAANYTANDRRVLESRTPMEFEEPISEGGAWGIWLSLKFPLFDEDGTPYAVGGISTDISDRNRAEALIREARDEAERANRAKSEFLSRMSHELRTPLNSILGFGQLLQMEALPASGAEGVGRIVKAGRHLLSLINEVLEISRIESGGHALSLEPVHACDPLNEAFELVRPLAAERRIELVRDLHPALYRFVLADYQRLKQVLLNLLMNAVKYNREGGTVSVSIEIVGEDRLRFRVTDTGQGMDPQDVEKIFVPFERLGADKTETEGTGLGLALSKTLVEAMGGSIGVERTVKGRGSVFFVELAMTANLNRDPGLLFQPDAAPLVASAELASATVLYIEDNLDNFELVRRVLAHVGDPSLIPAMQGQLGIELAAQHCPDVILLDLHLPDIDGEDVLRRLRKDGRTREIPVIMLSADATPAQIERLKALGATDYLTKPLEIPSFITSVRRAVESASL